MRTSVTLDLLSGMQNLQRCVCVGIKVTREIWLVLTVCIDSVLVLWRRWWGGGVKLQIHASSAILERLIFSNYRNDVRKHLQIPKTSAIRIRRKGKKQTVD